MRITALITLLAAPLALSACDSGEEAMNTEDMPMAQDNMPMAGDGAEMRMASAEGTVTAIDDEAGTVTINHGPVPAVDWPAMTMAFEADEDLREEVDVGDEVTFDFRMSESGNQITLISRK